jgi:ribose transport system permease protein
MNDIKKERLPVRKGMTWRGFIVKYGLLVAAILTWIIFAVLENRFYTAINIFTIIRQASIIGILGLGLGCIVINGDFDMSFAATTSLVGVIAITMMMNEMNPILIFVVGIGIGLAVGFVNSLLVVRARIPAFIATMGMMIFLQGVSKYISGGAEIYPRYFPTFYKLFGSSYTFGVIPNAVFTFVILGVIVYFFLDYSRRGRYMYASGGNPDAASHVGINVKYNRTLAFLIGGGLSGIAGLLLISTLRAANPTIGEGYLFPTVITVFLGSLFLKGGVVNVLGIILAALFMASLANGFTMIGLPFYAKDIAQGLILVIALLAICLLGQKAMRNITI